MTAQLARPTTIEVVVARIFSKLKSIRLVLCIPIERSCLLRYYPAGPMRKVADKMDDITAKPATGSTSAAVADSPPAAPATELAKETGISQVGESSHELGELPGLLFLGAFCILISHACHWLANFKDTRTVFNYGEVFSLYGMPPFFVLSGFLLP